MHIEMTTNILNDLFGLSHRIEIPGRDSITLRDLFDLWINEHGHKVAERLYEGGVGWKKRSVSTLEQGEKTVERLHEGSGLREEIVLLVNDTNLESLNGLDTEIRDGDRMVILGAVTGG